MATTKHNRRTGDERWMRARARLAGALKRARGRVLWSALGVLALVLGLAVWKGPRLYADAVTGASFGARVACSCRYIEGRPLASCKSDFEPGMDLVMLSEDSAAKSVTARFPLLASQTATYQAGAGCVLEKW
jgi:hypothetical protein